MKIKDITFIGMLTAFIQDEVSHNHPCIFALFEQRSNVAATDGRKTKAE